MIRSALITLVLSFIALPGPHSLATRPLLHGVPSQASAAENQIPVLAYYYIWYTPTSWNRAKTDLPLLGKYSSDETRVMREHIRSAKSAGIDGFIVSWKDTPILTPRLEKLIGVAREEDFHLVIMYQGLDYDRAPLPVEKVKRDVELFADLHANDEVFKIWDKPVLIVSGTWKYAKEEIASITESARQKIYILASEKDAAGIERLAPLVDGNAYYWSSVNPDTFPDYAGKLQSMSAAVHRSDGIWIAPMAPGFDARLVGGTTVVERDGGNTLRREYAVAIQSAPDALGLISWNEFSENSHVEPSQNFGASYLRILADILGAAPPSAVDFDSSGPEGPRSLRGVIAIATLVLLTGFTMLIAVKRARGRPKHG
jgi:Glycosyl hydrolase family 71